MDTLNAAQKQAAQTVDGPVIIVAGPGTGKTKTLTERIAFLVQSGTPAEAILALTFTKKAAQEMRARLGMPGVHASTFHGLCFDLLTQKTGRPQLITEPARFALIRALPKPAALKGLTSRELSLRLSRAKNLADDDAAIAALVAAYDAQLQARDVIDFDDILLQTRRLLQHDAAWRAQIASPFTHILIDEFQDTNLLQYELLHLLRSTDNICAIGDPLQSIYGFRGADGDIFARFARDFPAAVRVTLSINYRSATRVVALANAVYPDAPALVAHASEPGDVRAVEVLNEYSEAAWVLSSVERAIGGSDLTRAVSDDVRSDHRSLRDFAVLYRGRGVARIAQKLLVDSGIPVQIVGDGSPYEAPAVQSIIQIMARLVYAERPVVIKDLNAAQVDALVAMLDASDRPAELAEKLIGLLGVTLDASLRQFCGTLVRFATVVEAVAYFDDIAAQGFYDPRAEAVTLLTIHAAKGLEFPHVFLLATENDVLPSARGTAAEERRLFYVAVTRAKERLDILHARVRGGKKAVVSPFVSALPTAILPRIIDPALMGDQRRTAKRQAKRAQSSLF